MAEENTFKVKIRRGTLAHLDKRLKDSPETLANMGVCLITDTGNLFVPLMDAPEGSVFKGYVFEGESLGRNTLEEGQVAMGWPLVIGTAHGDMKYDGVSISFVSSVSFFAAYPSYVDTSKALTKV